ncbi:unnamed protein product [marine sediment metagenome]|uniref:PHP domain-containing protein n=1 Tax=marine sediment metagenome TaxID=412755 RepID=X1AHR5_9ZZZZ
MIQVLDRFSVQCAEAIEAGVRLIIGTDAHAPEHLNFLDLGSLTARRGWAEDRYVLNTLPVEEFLLSAQVR